MVPGIKGRSIRPVGNVQELRAIPRGLPPLKATERSEVTLERSVRPVPACVRVRSGTGRRAGLARGGVRHSSGAAAEAPGAKRGARAVRKAVSDPRIWYYFLSSIHNPVGRGLSDSHYGGGLHP